MKISVAIPAYEYNGFGVECLEYSFKQLGKQFFEDFEVVISDQSIDDEILKLCNRWRKRLHIRYTRNKETGNAAQNMNNAVAHCQGEWVKILCQDDYIAYSDSLLKTKNIIEQIEAGGNISNWLATGYLHTYNRKIFERYHMPQMNDNIVLINTIGTPSCTAFRNIKPMPLFDTNLSYYYDCDFYHRFRKEFGEPILSNEVTIVNYLWDKAFTAEVNNELIERETKYIREKYNL